MISLASNQSLAFLRFDGLPANEDGTTAENKSVLQPVCHRQQEGGSPNKGRSRGFCWVVWSQPYHQFSEINNFWTLINGSAAFINGSARKSIWMWMPLVVAGWWTKFLNAKVYIWSLSSFQAFSRIIDVVVAIGFWGENGYINIIISYCHCVLWLLIQIFFMQISRPSFAPYR